MTLQPNSLQRLLDELPYNRLIALIHKHAGTTTWIANTACKLVRDKKWESVHVIVKTELDKQNFINKCLDIDSFYQLDDNTLTLGFNSQITTSLLTGSSMYYNATVFVDGICPSNNPIWWKHLSIAAAFAKDFAFFPGKAVSELLPWWNNFMYTKLAYPIENSKLFDKRDITLIKNIVPKRVWEESFALNLDRYMDIFPLR